VGWGGVGWSGAKPPCGVGWGEVGWDGGGVTLLQKWWDRGGGRSHVYKSCGGGWRAGQLCYQSLGGEGFHLVTKIVAGVGVTLLQNLWGCWGINDLWLTSPVVSLEFPKGKFGCS